MKHRADIEGLRGVSVLLVVLAHAGIPGLQGGFIGVDVFFVISGYLITGLLIEELRDTGRIDAWRFYARRVRRLLPAFAAMVVVTLAAAALVLSPVELARQAHEAAWASAWSANLFQVVAETDYFDSTRETSLFLHAWSLGVEEQFYLVWPLLLWMAWRLVGAQRAVRVLLAFILVAGFAYAMHLAKTDPLAAYFLPQVRAWQFAAGAIAFVIADSARAPRGALAALLVASGLLAILVAALTIDAHTMYPGWAALAPTLGAAALLLGGASAQSSIVRALASSVPTAIGRVSYGWYLWHWPALTFAAALAPGNVAVRILAATGSLAVAWVVFRTIEDPIRRGHRGNTRRIVWLGVLGSLLLAAGSLALHRLHGPSSLGAEAANAPTHPILDSIVKPSIYEAGCDQWYRSATLVPCEIDLGRRGDRTAVIIGDSIGLQWFPALATVLRANNWNLVVLTKSACAMIDRPYYYQHIRREYTECEQWRDSAVEYIRRSAPALVLVGSAGNYPFDPDTWYDGTLDFLQRIAATDRRIVVLGPTPVLPFDASTCLMRAHAGLPAEAEVEECSVPLAKVALTPVESALRAAAAQVRGVGYLDAAALACGEERCAAWRSGMLAFRDAQHLNAPYAESLAPDFAKALMRAMASAAPEHGLPAR